MIRSRKIADTHSASRSDHRSNCSRIHLWPSPSASRRVHQSGHAEWRRRFLIGRHEQRGYPIISDESKSGLKFCVVAGFEKLHFEPDRSRRFLDSFYWLGAVALLGLSKTPTVSIPGFTSRKRPRRLASITAFKLLTPVIFPSGRLRLVTCPQRDLR